MTIEQQLADLAAAIEKLPQRVTGMPLPYQSEWSEQWAADWCVWFGQQLENPGHVVAALLPIINHLLRSKNLAIEVEAIEYDEDPSDMKGTLGDEVATDCLDILSVYMIGYTVTMGPAR